MKRGVLIIFVAILIPCLLQAQTTPNDPQRLTLEQAVNFAVEQQRTTGIPNEYRIEK